MGTTFAKSGGIYRAVNKPWVKQGGAYRGDGVVLYKKISGSYQVIWHADEAYPNIMLDGSKIKSDGYGVYGTTENYTSTNMTYRVTKNDAYFTSGNCITNEGTISLPWGGSFTPASGLLGWVFEFGISTTGVYKCYVTATGLLGSVEQLVSTYTKS